MKKSLKVLLIVGISLVILIAVVVGVGIYYLSQHGQELMATGRQARTEGMDLGKTTDNQGCLAQALTRQRERSGFNNAVANNLFLRGCLETSQPTAGFCDQVPQTDALIDSARWQSAQCEQAGQNDTYCQQLFAQVQQYCDALKTKAAPKAK